MKSGWIILDKDSGLFSRTAGAKIARMIGTKKFGHIGTLDPMASGVLPIAIGDATKMIPFVEDFSPNVKEYLFSLQFGFETDTLVVYHIGYPALPEKQKGHQFRGFLQVFRNLHESLEVLFFL